MFCWGFWLYFQGVVVKNKNARHFKCLILKVQWWLRKPIILQYVIMGWILFPITKCVKRYLILNPLGTVWDMFGFFPSFFYSASPMIQRQAGLFFFTSSPDPLLSDVNSGVPAFRCGPAAARAASGRAVLRDGKKSDCFLYTRVLGNEMRKGGVSFIIIAFMTSFEKWARCWKVCLSVCLYSHSLFSVHFTLDYRTKWTLKNS